MNCEKTQRWMQALVDDELNGWSGWRLRRHLVRCESCTQDLATIVRLRKNLAAHRVTIVADVAGEAGEKLFFWSQVRRRLNAEASDSPSHPAATETPSPWFGRAGFVVTTTLAMTLLLIATLRWQGRPGDEMRMVQTEIGDVETPFSNTHHMTYISAESGNTFIWIYGLPTELEDEEEVDL